MEKNNSKSGFLILSAILLSISVYSQKNDDPVRIDKNGRILWKNSNQEAFFWGVNYSAPFAHGFRQIGRLGEDREKNIDIDVYHLARLGINAYRIHVWACEISDSAGNLVENEHLKLLDYLIWRLQQRGVYTFLTPIRYGSPGYPEPDVRTSSFADKYAKSSMYLIPEAIDAQERYLKQFVSHINPYTGKAYKADPMIMGFEICNEPAHSKPVETTAFVKKMIGAIKSTGCTKPVFYNVTQNINLLEDFIRGGSDGVTFQWYPSGLVANNEVPGNFLPHIDNYYMPFKNEKFFLSQSRLVYEFDAADVGRSYLYPPMALSFKEAGMQWVTMFAYDPLALAPSNTEYQTHFLNLVYSPQKAISFKIACEIFRNPQYKRNREIETKPFEIDGLKISYSNDYSELVTNDLFYHSAGTSTVPPNRLTLRSIAGYKTSPVIYYNGYGAYLLDKISDGFWRLEVLPDAIWVRDPFSKAVPDIENIVIKWNKYEMGVDLPDLGKNFMVTGINDGNQYSSASQNGLFSITPGVYILSTKPITNDIRTTIIGAITANEFYAPAEKNSNTYFLHTAPSQVTENQFVEVSVKIVTPAVPVKSLVIQPFTIGFRGAIVPASKAITMKKTDEYLFKGTIPDTLIKPGILTYNIIEESPTGMIKVYPGGIKGPTNRWDYYNPVPYSIRVIPAGSEVQLFGPEESQHLVTFSGSSGMRSTLISSGKTGVSTLRFSQSQTEIPAGRPNNSGMILVMQNFIGKIIEGISHDAETYTQLVVCGKSSGNPLKFEVALISKEGNSYTAMAFLTENNDSQILNLKDFKEGRMFLLPRPYPGFLPFWYAATFKKPFSLSSIERIQLLVPVEGNEGLPGFELTSITIK